MSDTVNQEVVQPASGGYTVVAADLSERANVSISRQRVWMWWSRRDLNGFPEGWEHRTRHGGTVRRFDLDEVLTWYLAHYGVPAQRAS